ncbi:MAG: DNA-binding protein [bacterium]|nr:DNA-binding protein [bacterium]
MTEQRLQQKDRIILVGDKPFVNYVTSVSFQFIQEQADEVVIKARGKYTSRAIDVAEVAAKKFLNGIVEVTNIKIDSVEHEKEGRKIRVSAIEITLRRKKE